MNSTEQHPWKVFVPQNAATMIVGTFPPTKRNWSYDFFYPNKNNLFWKMMSAIAEKPLLNFSGNDAVEERKNILRQLHVAITDMGLEIERRQNNSLDENLIAVQMMDIFEILHNYPSIQKLIFTSSSGPSSAAGWFLQYALSKNILVKFPKGARPRKTYINFENRQVILVILYSPSPRAANRISFDNLVELYKNEIKEQL